MDLQTCIIRHFIGPCPIRNRARYYRVLSNDCYGQYNRYLVVKNDFNSTMLDIPTAFIEGKFKMLESHKDADKIALPISFYRKVGTYKSLEANFKQLISCNYYGFATFIDNGSEDTIYLYNGVFFSPRRVLAELRLQLVRHSIEDSYYSNVGVKMVIDSDCYLNRDSSVKKFICGKFMNVFLNGGLHINGVEMYNTRIMSSPYLLPTVEIGKPLTTIVRTAPPILLTKERITDTLLNNIKDIN